VASIDLETRSLLQASVLRESRIEIPPEHAAAGLVTVTRDPSACPSTGKRLTADLFRVYSVASDKPTDRFAGQRAPPSGRVSTGLTPVFPRQLETRELHQEAEKVSCVVVRLAM